MYDQRIMGFAIKAAHESTHKRHKFGAAIAYKGRFVSAASNIDCTHPRSPAPNKRIHAEVAAIFIAQKRVGKLSKASLYIARLTKKNRTPTAAMPCSSCYSYIRQAGFRDIYFTYYEDTRGHLQVGR